MKTITYAIRRTNKETPHTPYGGHPAGVAPITSRGFRARELS